jgi:hypothetical protein
LAIKSLTVAQAVEAWHSSIADVKESGDVIHYTKQTAMQSGYVVSKEEQTADSYALSILPSLFHSSLPVDDRAAAIRAWLDQVLADNANQLGICVHEFLTTGNTTDFSSKIMSCQVRYSAGKESSLPVLFIELSGRDYTSSLYLPFPSMTWSEKK